MRPSSMPESAPSPGRGGARGLPGDDHLHEVLSRFSPIGSTPLDRDPLTCGPALGRAPVDDDLDIVLSREGPPKRLLEIAMALPDDDVHLPLAGFRPWIGSQN